MIDLYINIMSHVRIHGAVKAAIGESGLIHLESTA